MARILILGGGYGGLRTALNLDSLLGRHPHHEITLVDQNESHQMIVRLHEVAAGSLDYDDVLVPFARLLRGKSIRFSQAVVTCIDLSERQVQTSNGILGYDKLVIALGSETNFFGVPGLKENSLELKSIQDAWRLRNHIDAQFAKAKDQPEAVERRALLSILIGGGGFTGCELVGEFADYRDHLARKHGIDPKEVHLSLVEGKNVLLGGFDPKLPEVAAHILRHRGIDLLLGRGLRSIEDGNVMLSDCQSLRAGTLIWTGGVKASRLVGALGLEAGAGGRVVVNPYTETLDHPGVYVVGDCALILDPKTGRPLAASAQLALQQGAIVAYNINAEIHDLPRLSFTPKIVAEIVSLGRWNAVGIVGPFRLSGIVPSLLKRAAAYRYLNSIGGPGLAIEKMGLGGHMFARLTEASRHSSSTNRKGSK